MSFRSIPDSPGSNTIQTIRFFLKYHRECIISAHYFRWYDYDELCTKHLHAMAEHFEPLRLAMASFAALLYSLKVNPDTREMSFVLYALALQHLREVLNQPLDTREIHPVVATALQLSTFDVSSPFHKSEM